MKEWFTFRLTHYLFIVKGIRVFVPMKTTQCKIIKTRWHCLVANTLLIICMAFIIRATHFKKEKWSIKHYLINCWKRWLFDVSTTFYFKFYVIRPPSQGYFMFIVEYFRFCYPWRHVEVFSFVGFFIIAI